MSVRVGLGYDVHPLASARPLVLGGVTIPSDRGLAGHSDADVLTHAVAEAILGALALGDLGTHFPDTDPRWANAHSLDLIRHVVALAHEHSWLVGNVDATITAAAPRLAPHRDAMRAALAEALGVLRDVVSVKASSGNGVGAEGRGECISARAVVLLERM